MFLARYSWHLKSCHQISVSIISQIFHAQFKLNKLYRTKHHILHNWIEATTCQHACVNRNRFGSNRGHSLTCQGHSRSELVLALVHRINMLNNKFSWLDQESALWSIGSAELEDGNAVNVNGHISSPILSYNQKWHQHYQKQQQTRKQSSHWKYPHQLRCFHWWYCRLLRIQISNIWKHLVPRLHRPDQPGIKKSWIEK